LLITVSSQFACFGSEIAASVSGKLGAELITRDTLLPRFLPDATAHEMHMLSQSAKFYLKQRGEGDTYIALLGRALHEFAETGSAVLLGFGAAHIFANENAIKVRVTAPEEVRVARIKKRYRVSAQEARNILIKADRKQARFVRTVFGTDINDASNYDLVLNTGALSADECAAAIMALARERELNMRMRKSTGGAVSNLSEVPVFKNEAEKEFARLLDMYNIEWKYEPKTFPIEWDAEGNVTKAFSPDFYIVNFDTYIEITAMNQRYVTEKNRKLKRMRELYPGANVKVVYKKDLASLAQRFNLGREE
jgi:cytidylate kinase